MSRIASKSHGVSIYNREDWNRIIEFLTDTMLRFEKALRKYINGYSKKEINNIKFFNDDLIFKGAINAKKHHI